MRLFRQVSSQQAEDQFGLEVVEYQSKKVIKKMKIRSQITSARCSHDFSQVGVRSSSLNTGL